MWDGGLFYKVYTCWGKGVLTYTSVEVASTTRGLRRNLGGLIYKVYTCWGKGILAYSSVEVASIATRTPASVAASSLATGATSSSASGATSSSASVATSSSATGGHFILNTKILYLHWSKQGFHQGVSHHSTYPRVEFFLHEYHQ